MNKRTFIILTTLLVAFGVIISHVGADVSAMLTPIADDLAEITDSQLAFTDLGTQATNGPGGCVDSMQSFLKFDVASALPSGHQITSASLSLVPGFSSGDMTVGLFGLSDDSWAEGPTQIPWASRPSATGTVTNLNTSSPQTANPILFSSSQAFVDFLNAELNGDGIATLAIIPTNCTAASNSLVMSSKDGGGTAPVLDIASSPTAVTLDNTSTSTPAASPLPYIALLALVVATGGAIWLRARRSTAV